MQVGKFPTSDFLKQNGLTEYNEVIQACIEGEIGNLEAAIEKNMSIFIQSGVYLAVEKLRHLALRNLLKKIALPIAKNPEEL